VRYIFQVENLFLHLHIQPTVLDGQAGLVGKYFQRSDKVMGNRYDAIVNNPQIADGEKIGCVVAADHLIAASVSNWGGYALAAAAALMRATGDSRVDEKDLTVEAVAVIEEYVQKCLPTEQDEIDLLNRCVAAGCRDGVSGKMEATVDGMPLETSLKCLRDIRASALGKETS